MHKIVITENTHSNKTLHVYIPTKFAKKMSELIKIIKPVDGVWTV